MQFRDREEAAHLLARRLSAYRGKNPLVLAIPRGAVVMGRILAQELGGELDVVLVRKLGAPMQPELAIGSVDEEGHIFLTEYAQRLNVPEDYVHREIKKQLQIMKERRRFYMATRLPTDPAGRIVIVVDDGIATGSTMIAALKSVRERKPAKLIAAAAVVPPENIERVSPYADEVVCLITPSEFYAVGQFYQNFGQVEDAEVISLLQGGPSANDPEVTIDADGKKLLGNLTVPKNAKGLVLFAHGSGSSRLSFRKKNPTPAKKGEINYPLIDRFTFVHFMIGFSYGLLGLGFGLAVLLALAWELLENPLKAHFPFIFPHGTADTLQNSVGDCLATILGWAMSRYII